MKTIADEMANWGSGFRRLKVETITAEEENERRDDERDEVRPRERRRLDPEERPQDP